MGVGKSYTIQLARPGGVGASSQFGHVLAYNFQALWHPWPPAKAELEILGVKPFRHLWHSLRTERTMTASGPCLAFSQGKTLLLGSLGSFCLLFLSAVFRITKKPSLKDSLSDEDQHLLSHFISCSFPSSFNICFSLSQKQNKNK